MDKVYLLAGIALPDIRRAVASKEERRKQTTDVRHPLFNHTPPTRRLKSRKSFITSILPLQTTSSEARTQMWKERLSSEAVTTEMGIQPTESLPPGANEVWANWRCLNRLRTGVGRCKDTLHKWGYTSGPTMCDCGQEPQTMQHLLECPLLEDPVTTDDLAQFSQRAQKYQVLRVTPKTENELNMLRNLESSLLGEQLSFWKGPTYVDRPVDIMVSPTLREDVVRLLGRRGIRLSTMVEDVQKDSEEVEANLNPLAFDYNNYNTIADIEQWVQDTAASSSLATAGVLGTSYEGRSIRYIKISSGGSKRAVVFHGGIHAREWITPATVMYMARYLVEGRAGATDMLNKFDFYIIPVMNPDGYAYTWSNDRMWRKTRKPNTGSNCVGTDPNRNFATGWGGGGSSGSPCSDIFRGRSAFDQAETAAIRDFVSGLGDGSGVAMYSDYHAYSQYWMTPYGYTTSRPANYNDQYAGAQAASLALQAVHGTRYSYGSIIEVIYQASGGSSDYFYAGAGVQYSYALEGRDTGRYGFQLPASQIQPSAEENWEALRAVVDYVHAN
ncbi:carboxypeptidase B-like [Amphiura filiformis]|uniref:carboxypeptidase B-like n=1 Tax=Amphiura filiformis TaxID=82378 RepID=UPI003B20C4E4